MTAVNSPTQRQRCVLCGMPIIGQITYASGIPYHEQCAHGPNGPFRNMAMPNPTPPKPLTEEDVRRVVREGIELSRETEREH